MPKREDDDDPMWRLEQMIQALGQVSATEQVMNNAQAGKHVDELRRRVQGVVAATRLKLAEAEQRKRVAAEIDQLVDAVSKIGNAAGRAVAGQADKLKAVARADTLAQMAEALRLISRWLGDPSAANQQKVDELIASVQAVTGTSPYQSSPEAEARRRAELEADVKSSLEGIFGDLKIKPPL